MNKIIINVEPGVLLQCANFSNGTPAETFKLTDIVSFVYNHQDVDEVVLVGSKAYLDKYKQQIDNVELSKYNKKIKCTIIG